MPDASQEILGVAVTGYTAATAASILRQKKSRKRKRKIARQRHHMKRLHKVI